MASASPGAKKAKTTKKAKARRRSMPVDPTDLTPQDLPRIKADILAKRILPTHVVGMHFLAQREGTAAAAPAGMADASGGDTAPESIAGLASHARDQYIADHGKGLKMEMYRGPATAGVLNAKAALLYTEDGFIFIWIRRSETKPEAVGVEDLLMELDRLSDEVLALYPSKPRNALQDRIANAAYSAMATWYNIMSSAGRPAGDKAEVLQGIEAYFRKEVAHLEEMAARLAVRQAKALYLIGTMTGLLSVALTWHAVWSTAPRLGWHWLALGGLLGAAAVAAAALGAFQFVKAPLGANPKEAERARRLRRIGFGGCLIALVTVAVTAYIIWSSQPDSDVQSRTAGILLFGALGTALSVMMRLPGDEVDLQVNNGTALMVVFGFLRPLVGGISGIALWVLVVGGWLPLEVPQDPAVQTAFFAGGAFLMGFSERLARDMVVTASGKLGGAAAKPGASDEKGQAAK